MIQRNIGDLERVLRVILGIYAMLLGFLFITGLVGNLLGFVGLVAFATGASGWCGLYALLGRPALQAATSTPAGSSPETSPEAAEASATIDEAQEA